MYEDVIKYEEVPDECKQFFNLLEEGGYETADLNVNLEYRPNWLNIEKCKKGQRFIRNHFFSFQYCFTFGLFILFAENLALRSLIFTGKLLTPFKAHKKILRGFNALFSWCQEEFLESNKTSMVLTQKMHKYVQTQFDTLPEEEIKKRTELPDIDKISLKLKVHKMVEKDFKSSCRNSYLCARGVGRKTNVIMSKGAFTCSQVTILGLLVTYPEYFGVYNASEDDLEAFAHFYRLIGYMWGLDDKYNLCSKDLNTIRQITKLSLDIIIKPLLCHVGIYWEYVLRCLIEGLNLFTLVPLLSFESIVLDVSNFLNVKVPNVKKEVGLKHYILFLLMRLFMFLQRIPGLTFLFNKGLKDNMKRGNKASPKMLNKWKSKKFDWVN